MPGLPTLAIYVVLSSEDACSCDRCHPSRVFDSTHDLFLHFLVGKYNDTILDVASDRDCNCWVDFLLNRQLVLSSIVFFNIIKVLNALVVIGNIIRDLDAASFL